MSGLLLRLGARALGRAGAVHTAARLPFAAAPALAEKVGVAPPELPPTIDAAGQPKPNPVDSTAAAGTTASESTRRRASAAPAPQGAIIEPPPVMVLVASGQPPPGRRRSASAALSTHFEPQAATDPAFPVQASPDAPPADSAKDRTRSPGRLAERSPARLSIPAIEPLLPKPPFTRPSAQSPWADRAAGPARGPVASDRAEETTEVHVTIGRIEVTAVHEPAQPSRPPPSKPAPMTLDEYLARRQGGQPGGNR